MSAKAARSRWLRTVHGCFRELPRRIEPLKNRGKLLRIAARPATIFTTGISGRGAGSPTSIPTQKSKVFKIGAQLK
jgi:hypothetical protein